MTLEKILEIIQGGGWWFIVLLASFIEIPKIKLNIWQMIIKAINKPILEEMNKLSEESRAGDEMLAKKLEEMDKRVADHIEQDSKDKATLCRQYILDMCNDMNADKQFNQETWVEIMRKIDAYELYCSKHPEFKNSLCIESIKELREAFHKRECKK